MAHHRKNIRLEERDYSWLGKYFITICTQKHECYLGEILNGMVKLSVVGQVAQNMWQEIPLHYPNVSLGPFIIMPNHVHGIIEINSVEPRHDAAQLADKDNPKDSDTILPGLGKIPPYLLKLNKFSSPVPGSVSVIVGLFKSSVSRWCNQNHHVYFAWQPRYYDHVIKDDNDYIRIEKYIQNNPAHWDDDKCFK